MELILKELLVAWGRKGSVYVTGKLYGTLGEGVVCYSVNFEVGL